MNQAVKNSSRTLHAWRHVSDTGGTHTDVVFKGRPLAYIVSFERHTGLRDVSVGEAFHMFDKGLFKKLYGLNTQLYFTSAMTCPSRPRSFVSGGG